MDEHMTMGHLKKVFAKAIGENHSFVAVAVKKGIQHDPEVIVNCTTNFREKLAYYLAAYEDNRNENTLELKNCKDIHIVGVESGNNLTVLFKKLGAM
jgi:hypothetical protein